MICEEEEGRADDQERALIARARYSLHTYVCTFIYVHVYMVVSQGQHHQISNLAFQATGRMMVDHRQGWSPLVDHPLPWSAKANRCRP